MGKWIIPIGAALTAVLVSIVTYGRLPEQMIVNFNPAQNANNWMDKSVGAFLLPALILFVAWMVQFFIRFEKDENKRKRAERTLSAIIGITSVMVLVVHGFLIAYNLGYQLSIAVFVMLLIGIVFVMIGNLIPRLPQGSYTWPKLEDSRYGRLLGFQGWLLMIFGFVFALLALLPNKFIFTLFFLLLGCFIVITMGKSVRVATSG